MFAPLRTLYSTRPAASPFVLAAVGSTGLVFAATPVLVGPVSVRYGVGVGTAGLISTAQVATFAIASFAFGRFASTSAWLLRAGLALSVAGNLASALAGSFPALLAARALTGIALGVITWIAWADAIPSPRAVGDVAAIGPVTAIIGSPVLALVAGHWSDRGVFVLLAGVALAALAFPGTVREAPPVGTKVSPSRSNRFLLVGLMLLTLSGSSLFVFAAQAAGAVSAMSPDVASLAFSANAAAGLIATRRTVSDRAGPWWLFGTALGALSIGHISSPFIFFAAMTVWGFSFWMAVPALMRMLAERSLRPDERMGDAQALMAIGRAFGPAIGGLILSSSGYASLATFAGAGLILTALVAIGVEVGRRRLPPTPLTGGA